MQNILRTLRFGEREKKMKRKKNVEIPLNGGPLPNN